MAKLLQLANNPALWLGDGGEGRAVELHGKSGFLIEKLSPDAYLKHIKLQVGDVLFYVNGEPVTQVEEFSESILSFEGQDIEYTFVREGRVITKGIHVSEDVIRLLEKRN